MSDPVQAAGLALVTPEGHALFLKRGPGSKDHHGEWDFPGGGMLDGEEPEDAALREAREETGWIPEDDADLGEPAVTNGGPVEFSTFRRRVGNPFVPELGEEHVAWAWAPLDDPPEPLHPGVREALPALDAMMESTHPRDPTGKKALAGGRSFPRDASKNVPWKPLREGMPTGMTWPGGSKDEIEAALDELERESLAFDFVSSRHYDDDGHLHVRCPISKANICPYLGSEIPGADELGLDPQKKYMLLRDPEELARAADSFNGKPLLSRHEPVGADDHRQDLTVGAVSGAEYEHPYLTADLVIWPQDAIADVESGEKRELSSGYRYTPDMTPGTHEGERYDGVMREIAGNHVALVREGRAGADVVVGDSGAIVANQRRRFPGVNTGSEEIEVADRVPTRIANVALQLVVRFIKGKLAKDATIDDLDLLPLFAGLTSKNFKERRPGIVAALRRRTRGRLAQDANLNDVGNLLASLSEVQEMAADEEVSEAQRKAMFAAAHGGSNLGIPKGVGKEFVKEKFGAEVKDMAPRKHQARDDDPSPQKTIEGSLLDEPEAHGRALDAGHEFLKSKLSEDDFAEFQKLAAKKDDDDEKKGEDEDKEDLPEALRENAEKVEEKAEKKEGAEDDPPDFKGKPVPGGKMITKEAMDAAIGAAAEATEKRVSQRLKAAYEARQRVRPWVGELGMALDSPEEVHRSALKALGFSEEKLRGVHPSAYLTILELQPKPGSKARREAPQAMDAGPGKDFADTFPETEHIRVI